MTKYDFLEILFYDRNQVDHKIARGLGRWFLSIHSSFFLPSYCNFEIIFCVANKNKDNFNTKKYRIAHWYNLKKLISWIFRTNNAFVYFDMFDSPSQLSVPLDFGTAATNIHQSSPFRSNTRGVTKCLKSTKFHWW